MRKVAGWGSQDIPSGSYPGTPRSPVRHPEIDGSKGPAGCASGPERPSPAIDRGPRAAAFRWGLGFSFRPLRGYPCIRVTKIFLSIPGWLDSDSQVATFIVDGPGGPTFGRLSMDRVKTGIIGLDTMLNGVQKVSKQEFSQHLERTKQRYKRIAVDSMTALKMFSMEGQDSRILIQSFLRFLAELEATTLIVSERLDRKKLETEFFLGRGEIRMHKWSTAA